MAFNYGNTLKTIFLVTFYVLIIPHSVLLGIFSLIVQYWINKILLLRRHKRPPDLGDALSHELKNLLEWVPLLIIFGAMLFEKDLFNKVQDLTFWAFFLALLLKEIFCRV